MHTRMRSSHVKKEKNEFKIPYLIFHHLNISEMFSKKDKKVLSLSNKLTLREGRNGEWKRKCDLLITSNEMLFTLISFYTLSIKVYNNLFPIKASCIDKHSCAPYTILCHACIWSKSNLAEGQRKLPIQ